MTLDEYLLNRCPWCGSEKRELRVNRLGAFGALTWVCGCEWHDNPWTIPKDAVKNSESIWTKFNLKDA